MPLLSSLVLPDAAAAEAAVAALQHIAPPVLSVEALLERDLEALEAQIDLPRGALAAFRKAVAHHYAPLRNASTLQDEEVLTPTGCAAIDALLGGGFRGGDVAEVVGPTCSGKTQLLLATACRASERGRNVAWVDAGSSSFSPARARSMKGRLDLIRVCFAEDAWAMLRSLDDAGRFLKPGDVCVVDAPSRVLTPNLGGDRNPQGHQLLALATRALQTLARQGVCVLVANSTARGLSDGMDDEGSFFDESWKAALGPVWSTCASLRLALAAPRDGVCRCALAKAPDGSRGEAAFRVCAEGVADVEPCDV
jgi:RAD51-like protein 3